MRPALLSALVAARAAKRPVVLATNLRTGSSDLLYPLELAEETALGAAARRAAETDQPVIIESAEGEIFLNVFNPPLRMAIVGAVHIAQPLAAMASLAGFAVTVIDPRTAFASDARFPGVQLMTDWPDEALAAFAPDRRTAIVTLTHDTKLDDAALDVALRSAAFYIGALGSRKTHAARLERLTAKGHDAAALQRIHGPAGLAIGAKSPAEIAVSILAEATAVLRRGAPA